MPCSKAPTLSQLLIRFETMTSEALCNIFGGAESFFYTLKVQWIWNWLVTALTEQKKQPPHSFQWRALQQKTQGCCAKNTSTPSDSTLHRIALANQICAGAHSPLVIPCLLWFGGQSCSKFWNHRSHNLVVNMVEHHGCICSHFTKLAPLKLCRMSY